MNIFKQVTLTWWQIAVSKVALIGLGAALGSYWSEFFIHYVVHLVVIAAAVSAYLTYVWFKQ